MTRLLRIKFTGTVYQTISEIQGTPIYFGIKIDKRTFLWKAYEVVKSCPWNIRGFLFKKGFIEDL